ncbi:WEB family protein-like protein [Tanacetum coccineum]
MAMNVMSQELHEMIFQEDLFLTKEKSGFVEHKNLQPVPVVLDNLHILGKLYDKVRTGILIRLSLNSSEVSFFKEEVDLPRELHRLTSETEQFKKVGEVAKSEVLKAMNQIKQTKCKIKTAEMRLMAARKLKEAARVSEALARLRVSPDVFVIDYDMNLQGCKPPPTIEIGSTSTNTTPCSSQRPSPPTSSIPRPSSHRFTIFHDGWYDGGLGDGW